MKKILLLFIALFLGFYNISYSQLLDFSGESEKISNQFFEDYLKNNGSRNSCTDDLVMYIFEKNVKPVVSGFPLQDSVGRFKSASQWFDAPQNMELTGFICWMNPVAASQSVRITVHAAGADSLPTGTPLISLIGTINQQDTLRPRPIDFPNSVSITGPYVISITNTGTLPSERLNVYRTYQNSQYPQDSLSGRGENLAIVEIGGLGWRKLKTLYASQTPPVILDVDFAFLPLVTYSNLSVTAELSEQTVCTGEPFNGSVASSSAIFNNRFYNRFAFRNHFFGATDSTYKWVNPGQDPVYGNAPTLTGINSGTINVELEARTGWSNQNPCSVTDSKAITVDACTGIESKSALEAINIYPNPTTGVLNISTTEASTITVMNMLGAVVTETVSANGNNNTSLDLGSQPKGIYLVKVSTEAGSVVKKISLR